MSMAQVLFVVYVPARLKGDKRETTDKEEEDKKEQSVDVDEATESSVYESLTDPIVAEGDAETKSQNTNDEVTWDFSDDRDENTKDLKISEDPDKESDVDKFVKETKKGIKRYTADPEVNEKLKSGEPESNSSVGSPVDEPLPKSTATSPLRGILSKLKQSVPDSTTVPHAETERGKTEKRRSSDTTSVKSDVNLERKEIADAKKDPSTISVKTDSKISQNRKQESEQSNNASDKGSNEETGTNKNESANFVDENDPEGEDGNLSQFVRFISDDWSLIEKVKAALDDLNVRGIRWTLCEDDIYLGMFLAEDGERCEEILDRLAALSIGVIEGSSVCVFPSSISVANLTTEEEPKVIHDMLQREEKLEEKVSEFKKSIKSRLVVAQVVNSVKADALFTFDYLMLLVLASLVAVMGLLEASSVVLVASMLISPLMGPILAGVFGAVIRNTELLKLGIKSELSGLTLCILVGFITGFIPAALETAELSWRSTENWPTIEMSSRGALRSLPVGVLIAIPSGAGVALSILGGKVGSLVGVAISASLLPPAVNAGLLWANAVVVSISPPRFHKTTPPIPSNVSTPDILALSGVIGTVVDDPPPECPVFIGNDYSPQYYCDMAWESVVLGVMSLVLTLLNIFFIILMGIIVLKIKEVAPIRSAPQAEKEFFGKDLKIARESYQTTKGQSSALLGKKLLQEYKVIKGKVGIEDDENDNMAEFERILKAIQRSPGVADITRRMINKPKRVGEQRRSSLIDESPDHHEPNNQSGSTWTGSYQTLASDGYEMELRPRFSFSPNSPRGEEKDGDRDSLYYTIHRYIPAHELHQVRSRTSGRFKKYVKIPLTSRFEVAKVNEQGKQLPKHEAMKPSSRAENKLQTITEGESIPLISRPTKDAHV